MIVADSGPLIAFALLRQLDLLRTLYKSVLVPPAVWAEVTDNSERPGAIEIRETNWLERVPAVRLADALCSRPAFGFRHKNPNPGIGENGTPQRRWRFCRVRHRGGLPREERRVPAAGMHRRRVHAHGHQLGSKKRHQTVHG